MAGPGPIVTVSEGVLQGAILKSVLGIDYLAFRGIPYAQPPLGPLRFKPPQPPLKWARIRDAADFGSEWPLQKLVYGPLPWLPTGTEDSLYLNVYTNKIGKNRPVLFYIYGGGFLEGNGNTLYREDYLVSKDVVLVTVNYRLGPMGFLNLGHEEASGNQGLRDILFALKWVQKNIEAFGGDPHNITIFGNSAGAMICHLFTLIPMAKGLFQKAILQSGSMFMTPTLLRQWDFKNGFKLASLLGMNSKDPVEVLEFLREIPGETLVNLEDKLIPLHDRINEYVFEYEPIYDAPYTKDPVIPVPLAELLKRKTDVPIILLQTKNESLLDFAGKFDDEEFFKMRNDTIEGFVKNSLLLKDTTKLPEIMKYMRDNYLDNKPITTENPWNIVNLMTDLNNAINERLIDYRNENEDAPSYVCYLSYEGTQPTFFSFDKGPQPLHGIAHADELAYMFYFEYMHADQKEDEKAPKEGTKDRIMMERFLRMWYNFALTGDPTSKLDDKFVTTVWKPSSKDHLYYLDMGEELTLRDRKDPSDRNGQIYEKIKSWMDLD